MFCTFPKIITTVAPAWTLKDIKERIDADQSIKVEHVKNSHINASLPETGGSTPLHRAIMKQRPGHVDTFLKHPNVDPMKVDNDGVTPARLALFSQEQLATYKKIRTQIDNLPDEVKNLIRQQANQNPPQAQADLLTHSQLTPFLKETFEKELPYPENDFFQKAKTGNLFDPYFSMGKAHQTLDEERVKNDKIVASLKNYGTTKNIDVFA